MFSCFLYPPPLHWRFMLLPTPQGWFIEIAITPPSSFYKFAVLPVGSLVVHLESSVFSKSIECNWFNQPCCDNSCSLPWRYCLLTSQVMVAFGHCSISWEFMSCLERLPWYCVFFHISSASSPTSKELLSLFLWRCDLMQMASRRFC